MSPRGARESRQRPRQNIWTCYEAFRWRVALYGYLSGNSRNSKSVVAATGSNFEVPDGVFNECTRVCMRLCRDRGADWVRGERKACIVTHNLWGTPGLRRPITNGMLTSSDTHPVTVEQNHLLASLPRDEYARLCLDLEPVCLRTKHIVAHPDEPIRHVYFLRDAVVSLLVAMEDGSTIEVASVGSEGLIGLGAFLGEGTETGPMVVQIPGRAARMTTTAFHEAVWRSARLQLLLQRYTLAFINQLARTAGCNRVHSVRQRCARLLLMIDDRLPGGRRVRRLPPEPTGLRPHLPLAWPPGQPQLEAMLGDARPGSSLVPQ